MKRFSRPMPFVVGSLMIASAAFADSTGMEPGGGLQFSARTGEELYATVCAACHMPHGEGAVGAGAYPALARNPNLEAGSYPVFVLLQGLNGMPPVGRMMSDEQVAAVVNYVRTHFGNSYTDKMTPEEVAEYR